MLRGGGGLCGGFIVALCYVGRMGGIGDRRRGRGGAVGKKCEVRLVCLDNSEVRIRIINHQSKQIKKQRAAPCCRHPQPLYCLQATPPLSDPTTLPPNCTFISSTFFITMSNVGIPIKLLFEAEGMKVTVEVRASGNSCLQCSALRWLASVIIADLFICLIKCNDAVKPAGRLWLLFGRSVCVDCIIVEDHYLCASFTRRIE